MGLDAFRTATMSESASLRLIKLPSDRATFRISLSIPMEIDLSSSHISRLMMFLKIAATHFAVLINVTSGLFGIIQLRIKHPVLRFHILDFRPVDCHVHTLLSWFKVLFCPGRDGRDDGDGDLGSASTPQKTVTTDTIVTRASSLPTVHCAFACSRTGFRIR